ncbi:MAG TPA: cellulose biosynthesis cyclic di-GMP-binding regulatory protein BcsB, partial [Nitrosomonas sp.]|nr:cellulose biosynthesis cyclic di-GMP-binding regulatory protein BcsB [Nitrosomonas sp.]
MKRHFQIMNYLLTLVMLTVTTFSSVQPARAQAATLTLSFAKLGYGDLQMRSLLGAASIWIPTRSDWVLRETKVSLRLNYIASPLLISDSSTMTVSAAGSLLTSWRPITDGLPHTVEFDVPTSKMSVSDNGFVLTIQGYLIIDKELCQTTDDPGQWVKILNDSSVSFNPLVDTSTPQLEGLADEIVVKNSIDTPPPPVLFVLPENPDAVDLTAAGEVAARLSRESAKTRSRLIKYNVETVSTLQADFLHTSNVVIIGDPTRNTLIQDLRDSLVTPLNGTAFTTTDSYDAPVEDGVIQLIPFPGVPDRRILIVSGGSPEGVAKAGSAFSDSPTFRSLAGKIKFVHAPEPVKESDMNPAWQEDKTSFAQLHFGTRMITGVGTYDEEYLLEFPPGWVLQPGSKLVLNIASSPALSSEQSHIAVFLNELPIGTVAIGENAQNNQVIFDLPVQQINVNPIGELPHKMIMRMSITNYLRRDRCLTISDASAWTQISDSSYFVTSHTFMTVPDLQAFPYPFVNDETKSTVIIIPEKPTNEEIETALSLASTLGRYTPSDFALKIITADKATDADVHQSNLIIIGTPERNPLI